MIHKITTFLVLNCCFIITACNTTANKTQPDCARFKKGNFYFKIKQPGLMIYYSVARNSSVQTEINPQTKDTTKYRILWINDCNYELRFLTGTEMLPPELLQLKKSMTITTAITGATDKYYLFRSKTDKSDIVVEDTMWIRR